MTSYALSPQVSRTDLRRAVEAEQEKRDPVAWMQRHFYIPELDGPLQLAPYQQACLREALARNPDGTFKYSVIVWSDVKKSIKSTIAAAVALWRAYSIQWGSVKIVANDLKQADSRVAYYLRRAIELNPAMRAQAQIKLYRVTLPNRTAIEAIPVDPKGEAGGNDDMICFSELWAANQTAAQRMWTEMTLSPMKYGQSFRWVETYAGYSGESPLLEQLYESGVKQGRQLDLGIDGLEVYANDAARMFCLWNTQPRLPWQTDAYYAQEAAVLTPNEFQRVHRNQWVSSTDTFVQPEWWDACQEPLPPLSRAEPLVLGVDAGIKHDCFAVVGVTRHPDAARYSTDVAVRFVRVWKPQQGQPLDFGADEGPEKTIRWLCDQYNVVQVAYDPHQLHDMMTRIGKDGAAWCSEFPQGEKRLDADKGLRDMIVRKGLAHDGNADLRRHVTNAASKMDEDGRRLRIVKKTEDLEIDACVSLSEAAHECLRLNL